MNSRHRPRPDFASSTLAALRSSGLLDKLVRVGAGRVVRCSRQSYGTLLELTGLPLTLEHHEASAWKGYILKADGTRGAEAVTAWLRRHDVAKPQRKSTLERQLDWQSRAQQRGMRKLATYLSSQAAHDLDTIIESMGGREKKGSQRAAVEIAITEKAARLRRGRSG